MPTCSSACDINWSPRSSSPPASESERRSNRRTVKNWLNELNGSWKTAWTSCQ